MKRKTRAAWDLFFEISASFFAEIYYDFPIRKKPAMSHFILI